MQITSNNMVSVWYSASNAGIYLQHFFASATSETCPKDHALGNSGRVFWPWPSLWAFLKLGYPKNHWFAHSICLLDDNLRSRKKEPHPARLSVQRSGNRKAWWMGQYPCSMRPWELSDEHPTKLFPPAVLLLRGWFEVGSERALPSNT